MKIVLASANKGKIKEFERLLPNDEIVAFSEILGKIEIDEDKDTFKGNAIKKAQTIYDELQKINFGDVVVISDDSGISVPVLGNVSEVPGLVLATGFCGHGFGIAPAIGHELADLIVDGKTSIDINALRYDRFKAKI